MSRIIAPATPEFGDLGDTVHPVTKGGFGANTEESIKDSISSFDRNKTGPGSTIAIGANGKADLSQYGVVADYVTISGPTTFFASETTEYTINNYSSLNTYTVEVSSGSVTVVGNKITLSANIVPDQITMTINGRVIILNKEPVKIATPTLNVTGTQGASSVTLVLSSSGYSSADSTTHFSTDWQVATDAEFSNIVASSMGDIASKVNKTFTFNKSASTVFYSRVRHTSNLNRPSKWSTTVITNQNDLQSDIAVPALTLVKGSTSIAGVNLTVKTSAFQSSSGGTHTGTVWVIASDSNFSTVIKTVDSTTELTQASIGLSTSEVGNTTFFYIRAKHKAGTDESNWSNTVSVDKNTLLNGTPNIETGKLLASDGTSSDGFGYSVSITSDGSRVAVGAYGKTNGSFTMAGAVYIYLRTGSSWTQEAKLLPSDSATSDQFGYSVSISSDGSRVAIGAQGKNISQGAVYIFSRTGTMWTQEAKLLANDRATDDLFGHSISITSDGFRVGIGAVRKSGPGGGSQGAAYVFLRTGTTWTQEAKLIASDGASTDLFGQSISIAGNGSRIAIGANARSKVYIFSRTNTLWIQETIFSDTVDAINGFGYSVSMTSDGSRVAIGAFFTSQGQRNLYVYFYNGGTWIQEAKFLPDANNLYGESVSINATGDRVITGGSDSTSYLKSQGSVNIFIRNGNTWTKKARLLNSDAAASTTTYNDYFGTSVSFSADGSILVAGATGRDDKGTDSGGAYIFESQSFKYQTQEKFEGSPPANYDGFGYSSAVTPYGDKVVIGAKDKVYVFTATGNNEWSTQTIARVPANYTNMNFGASVSISADGKRIAIGSTMVGNESTGFAYIYYFNGTTWIQEASLVPTVTVSGGYGCSISISADGATVIVGDQGYDSATLQLGSGAYIFSRSGTTWTQQTYKSGPAHEYFGTSVSISADGSTAAIGAPGYKLNGATTAGAVFIATKSGSTWSIHLSPTIYGSEAGKNFGYSVSISSNGSRVVIGCPYRTGTYAGQGAAYIYSRSGTTWVLESGLTYNDPAANDRFGYSVSMNSDGSRVAIGAHQKAGPVGTGQGAAYVFTRTNTTWNQEAKLMANDAVANHSFGFKTTITGNGSKVIVGTWRYNSTGAAYIFS